MAQAFPGFSSPAAGPEEPLEMLAACHERVGRTCATLRRLALYVSECGSDSQAQEAAASVMRYFDTAAVNHHADEEADLFPALLESMAGSDAVCIRELTQSLVAEHRVLEDAWQRLRTPLQQIAQGQPATLPAAEVENFIDRYRQHIEREDGELFPMAERLLSEDDLERIGLAMAKRRMLA